MDDLQKIKAAFERLTESADTSKMRRFISVLPEIEAARDAGVKHQQIIEKLNEFEFSLTFKTYSVMLSRARKRRGKDKTKQKKNDSVVTNGTGISVHTSQILVQPMSKRNGIPEPQKFVWDPNTDPEKLW
jgi:hypothetical protein